MKITKSELKEMIREVLREELHTKKEYKLTESRLANVIKTAITDPSAIDISEISARVHQKLGRVDFPEESDMTVFDDTTIFRSKIVGDYLIRAAHLPTIAKLETLADNIYKYERINRYASYEVFQFLLTTLKIPFQIYFD